MTQVVCSDCGIVREIKDYRLYRTNKRCKDCFWKLKRITKNCKFCDKQFTKKLSDTIRKGRGQFCGKECFDKWQARTRIDCSCLECGKKFKIVSYSRQKGMFCSMKCRNSSWGRKTIEKYKDKVYNGRLGNNYYRKLAFEAFENSCKMCGYDNKPILEVDHIDGNHLNNNLSNLQILCPNCHKEKTYKHLILLK